ncbi:MAG: hypothetical protein MUC29_00200 [Pyrinomonadaceae bacterium]|jgi:hypothetical protein|nr:hypothetical protein [Pyrinomonadaceae bacterium]
MSRDVKITIIIITLILGGFVFLLFSINSMFDMCGTSDAKKYDSLNHQFTAISYTFGCGVTSSEVLTKIDLTKKFLYIPHSTENAVVFDHNTKTELFWKSDDELVIKVSSKSKIYKKQEPFGIKINIEYTD